MSGLCQHVRTLSLKTEGVNIQCDYFLIYSERVSHVSVLLQLPSGYIPSFGRWLSIFTKWMKWMWKNSCQSCMCVYMYVCVYVCVYIYFFSFLWQCANKMLADSFRFHLRCKQLHFGSILWTSSCFISKALITISNLVVKGTSRWGSKVSHPDDVTHIFHCGVSGS